MVGRLWQGGRGARDREARGGGGSNGRPTGTLTLAAATVPLAFSCSRAVFRSGQQRCARGVLRAEGSGIWVEGSWM
eukprot:3233389-Rhodomonas_salina.1